ncbi:MAG: LamG domain-containing protein, partial [Flavobacteriia bacterium]|nr:LamG domain-containing protein [Flavobacteriia bacterium]
MKKPVISALLSLFSLGIFAQIPTYVPANGLVGWWPFNGNANDESGNGNHGTVNGATLTTDRFGNVNGAYSFNGSNVLIPLNQQIVSMSERTVSLWFYSAQAQSGGRLFEATNYSWGIGCYNNTTFDCWYQKSNQAYNIVGESFQSHNTWYNLVYVCDSTSQTKKIYLNGTLIYTGLPVSNPGNPITWQNHFLKIGQGNANESFIGSIDDIAIWNRALTQCEIQDLYMSQINSTFVSAGADQTICNGEQVTLSASNSQNYSWNNGVTDTVSFSPTTTQDYIVTADTAGCLSSDTVTVYVNQPSSSTLNQTALDSYTLNGQTYTQSGTYTQTVPAANGCD